MISLEIITDFDELLVPLVKEWCNQSKFKSPILAHVLQKRVLSG